MQQEVIPASFVSHDERRVNRGLLREIRDRHAAICRELDQLSATAVRDAFNGHAPRPLANHADPNAPLFSASAAADETLLPTFRPAANVGVEPNAQRPSPRPQLPRAGAAVNAAAASCAAQLESQLLSDLVALVRDRAVPARLRELILADLHNWQLLLSADAERCERGLIVAASEDELARCLDAVDIAAPPGVRNAAAFKRSPVAGEMSCHLLRVASTTYTDIGVATPSVTSPSPASPTYMPAAEPRVTNGGGANPLGRAAASAAKAASTTTTTTTHLGAFGGEMATDASPVDHDYCQDVPPVARVRALLRPDIMSSDSLCALATAGAKNSPSASASGAAANEKDLSPDDSGAITPNGHASAPIQDANVTESPSPRETVDMFFWWLRCVLAGCSGRFLGDARQDHGVRINLEEMIGNGGNRGSGVYACTDERSRRLVCFKLLKSDAAVLADTEIAEIADPASEVYVPPPMADAERCFCSTVHEAWKIDDTIGSMLLVPRAMIATAPAAHASAAASAVSTGVPAATGDGDDSFPRNAPPSMPSSPATAPLVGLLLPRLDCDLLRAMGSLDVAVSSSEDSYGGSESDSDADNGAACFNCRPAMKSVQTLERPIRAEDRVEDAVALFAFRIFSALHVLHTQLPHVAPFGATFAISPGFIHHDIHLSNVLVQRGSSMVVLCDFELVSHCTPASLLAPPAAGGDDLDDSNSQCGAGDIFGSEPAGFGAAGATESETAGATAAAVDTFNYNLSYDEPEFGSGCQAGAFDPRFGGTPGLFYNRTPGLFVGGDVGASGFGGPMVSSSAPPAQMQRGDRIPPLLPPECAATPRGDVWAATVMLLEAVTGIHPLLDITAITDDLGGSEGPFRRVDAECGLDWRHFDSHLTQACAPWWGELPSTFKEFCARGLANDPADRATALEMLQHPFVTEREPRFDGIRFPWQQN
jgi:hypothetical protein